jgi:hypothetical protein
MSQRYPTELTETPRTIVTPCMPAAKPGGLLRCIGAIAGARNVLLVTQRRVRRLANAGEMCSLAVPCTRPSCRR